METYTIDATGKKLGRIASEAAFALMGKHTTSYAPNAFPTIQVTVKGVSALDISDKKSAQKTYDSYSGYPSGLRVRSLGQIAGKQGNAEVLRIAIRGMLPSNKLRARRMKLLTIEG